MLLSKLISMSIVGNLLVIKGINLWQNVTKRTLMKGVYKGVHSNFALPIKVLSLKFCSSLKVLALKSPPHSSAPPVPIKNDYSFTLIQSDMTLSKCYLVYFQSTLLYSLYFTLIQSSVCYFTVFTLIQSSLLYFRVPNSNSEFLTLIQSSLLYFRILNSISEFLTLFQRF